MKAHKQFGVVRGLTLAMSVLISSAAIAETYYWNKSGDNDGAYYKWSDPENWLVGDTKVAATTVPGEDDVIKRDNDQKTESMYIDLEGESISIGGILFNSGSWGGDTIYVKNGSLTFTSEASFSARGVIHLDDASMIFNGTSRFGHWNYGDDAKYQMDVTLNGTSVLEINASTYLARVGFTVNNGAVLRFGTGVKWENANASKEVPISINGGVLDMPNGHKPGSDKWSYHPHVVLTTGQWNLGNEVKYANNIKFYTELVGGTLKATENVKFTLHADAWGKFNVGANVTLDVVEGKTLDLSNFTFDGAATVTKTGTGALKLKDVPSGLKWQEGAITFADNTQTMFSELALPVNSTLTLSNKDTSISYLSAMDGLLTIAAQGLTIDTAGGASLTGTFALDASVFAVGDTILVSEDENLRAKVMADLKAIGNNIVEEGTALKLGASELIFDSTTVKDLSDPNGWSCGSVPPAGASVTIKGSGVEAEVLGELPVWAAITLTDGAKLTTKEACAFGKIALSGGATLEVAAETTLTDGLAFEDNLESADGVSAITVATGATLKVPGGTKFKNVALTLNGSLIGLTDGPFVFGTANADETAYFAMTATGATVTALNGVGVENGSRIDFAVPAVGGAVVVAVPITLTGTTFTYNKKDGFAFGLNNPSDQIFQVIADNTKLRVGADTSVAGGANLVLKNGSVLLRERTDSTGGGFNSHASSRYNLYINNCGKITVGDGGEIRGWITQGDKNKTDGAITFNPDEVGFVGLEVLEGGTGFWWKVNGQNKGTIQFADGTFEFYQTTWWGWANNHARFLDLLAAIDIPSGRNFYLKGIDNRKGYNAPNSQTMNFIALTSPVTGGGNLIFSNGRPGTTAELDICSEANTCTGTIEVLPDDGDKKARLHFANGATWAGTVKWNDRTDLIAPDDDNKAAAEGPVSVSFGAVVCDEPTTFTFRLWGGDEFKNDTVNMTGAGWGEDFTLNFAIQGGYEAKPGDAWCLGTIPANSILPASPSEKWSVYTEEIVGDDDFVKLMAGPASLEFNFVSTESGDLTDPNNWECGYVPIGKDIVIKGAGVKAVVTDAATMPAFGSIEVREGASLAFEQAEGEVTIPSFSMDATATVSIGGDGLAPVVTLIGTFDSHVVVDSDSVQMPTIFVAAGATLNVPGGTGFKNCRMNVCGTIAEQGLGTVTFGAAQSGETAYFALNAEGATITATNGVAFASPDVGGTVVVTEPIVLKDSTLTYADKSGMAFGRNNPAAQAFEVIADNTPLNYGNESYVAGGANLILTNGTVLFRAYYDHSGGNFNYNDHSYFNLYVQSCGRVTVHEDCEIRAGIAQGDNQQEVYLTKGGIMLNPDEIGYVCIDMKDGSIANWWKMNGNGKGVVRFGDCTYKCFQTQWWSYNNGMRPFYNLAAMEVNEGATFVFQGTEEKIQDTNNNTMDYFEFISPITGAGNVVVQNSRSDKTLKAHLVNGANTCTGTLGLGTDEGTAKSELYIDKGANWAGTLVWDDRVHLVTEENVPETLSFGAVELNGNLPIRVWVDENGVVTSDTINITGAGFSGEGKIVLDFQGEVNPAEIDGFVPLGTLPAGAALPVVKKNAGATWKVITQQEGDKIVYGIKRSTGLIITVL